LRLSTVWTRAALLLAVAVCAPDAGAETARVEFNDIPRLIRERNQAVSGAALQAGAAKKREGSLLRSFLPSAFVEAGAERFQMGEYGYKNQPFGSAEVQLNLFRGGRDYWQERLRRSLAVAAGASASEAVALQTAEARSAFWRLIHAREVGALIKKAEAENLLLLERADRRIRRGLAAQTDRLEFEIQASQLSEDRESAAHSELQLRLRLGALLGFAEGGEIETPLAIEHLHDESLLTHSFDPDAHREAAALRAQRDKARAESRSASLWWAPSLDAYAGKYMYTLRDRDYLSASLRDDFAVGAKLGLRLFDGGAERAEARAKGLEADGEEKRLAQRRADLKARVRIIEEDLKHDHELVHFAEERILMSRRYFNSTLEEYDRGVKNSPDVLAAAQRLFGYERQLAERRRDYQLTKTGLLQEHGL